MYMSIGTGQQNNIYREQTMNVLHSILQYTDFRTLPHPPSFPKNGTLSVVHTTFDFGTLPFARYDWICLTVNFEGAVTGP